VIIFLALSLFAGLLFSNKSKKRKSIKEN